MANPTVPNPATWASGPVLVPALRADVDNAIAFLSGPPLFMGYNAASTSIPTGPTTPVTLDSEAVDTWGGHMAPASEYYCCAPGWHMVFGMVQYAYTTATLKDFSAWLQLGSGTTVSSSLEGEQVGGGSGQDPVACAADLVQLTNAGTDFVQLAARQDSAAAVNLAGNPYLAVRWVCASSGVAGLPVPANPAWPVPPAYVTSAGLNTGIRDTIRFLSYPPVFRGYYNGSGNSLPSQTFPSGTTIPLDTTSGTTAGGGPAVDTYSGWNSGGNYWSAPVAGIYAIYGQVAVATVAANCQLAAGITVNGATTWLKSSFQQSAAVPRSALACGKFRLNAGDQVKLTGFQNSGSSLSLEGAGTAGVFNKLICVWEAA